MKFTAATILAVVGLVAAQLDGIPDCATSCLNQALTSTGRCQPGDIPCLCNPANYQAIVSAGTPCVLSSCGAEVAVGQVLPAAGRICAAVAGGGGPASASSVAPAAVSSAQAALSSAVATAASSVRIAVSSAVAAASSSASQAIATATGSAVPVSTRTAVVTNAATTRNGTTTATSTVTPITVNGAPIQGPLGVLAMLAVGAFAAL